MRLILQLLANGLVNGALYAMLAVGFGLVWRSLRVFHVAFGGLFVASAYCFHTLVMRVGLHPAPAFLGTLIFAGFTGWLCEIGLYRPFARKGAASSAVLIASLGAFVAMENFIALAFGNKLQTVSRGLARAIHIGPVILTEIQLLQLVVGFGTIGLLWVLVCHLRTFKALWAMGDQPELIPVLGLPVHKLRALVLVLSTVMAAVPASLICLDIGTDPHVGMSYLLISAVAVLVGGANSYAGWVVGGVALAVMQSLAVWKFSSRWMDLVTFGLLVTMLVFRRNGLVDPQRRVEEPA